MGKIVKGTSWDLSRYGGLTIPQYKRWMEQLGPINPKLVHQLSNGWTVARPTDIEDVAKIGELMGNCWQNGGAGGPLDTDLGHGPHGPHVLLDEHGIPRVVFNLTTARSAAPAGVDTPREFIYRPTLANSPREPKGHGNSPLKPEHWNMLNEWSESLPEPILHWRSNEGSQLVPISRPGFGPKKAGMTRKQLLEQASKLPEDRSKIVAQHPNGWTLREPTTYSDLVREGELMSNCFSPGIGIDVNSWAPIWYEHPDFYFRDDSDNLTKDPSIARPWGFKDEDWNQRGHPHRIDLPLPYSPFTSLRDPDNIPHVTSDYNDDLGRHNDPPKEKYLRIMDEMPDEMPRQSKVSDYNGWTNWHTWNTKLMMDNEQELYQMQQKMAQEGWTPEQIRDWALEHVLGPHNKQAIEDSKEWNSIPEEERIDHSWEELKDKSPQAADMANNLGFGPNVSDDVPNLLDPELVNWNEIHRSIMDDHEANQRWEAEQRGEPLEKKTPIDPDKPGDFTLPEHWSSWDLGPSHITSKTWADGWTRPTGRGVFYHVAPSEHRESILREGLRGHKEQNRGGSPWGDLYEKRLHPQPLGNYLFTSPKEAWLYAQVLRNKRGMMPLEEAWEKGYVDEEGHPVEPIGHDIWKVNIDPDRQTVHSDPEPWLISESAPWLIGDARDDEPPSLWQAMEELKHGDDIRPTFGEWQDNEYVEKDNPNYGRPALFTPKDEEAYPGSGGRLTWYTPHRIDPDQLELNNHLSDIGDSYTGENEMDEAWGDAADSENWPGRINQVPITRHFGSPQWTFRGIPGNIFSRDCFEDGPHGWRIPIVIDPDQKIAWHGPPGAIHADVRSYFADEMPRVDSLVFGGIRPPSSSRNYARIFGYQEDPSWEDPEVIDYYSKLLGLNVKPDEFGRQDSGWVDSATFPSDAWPSLSSNASQSSFRAHFLEEPTRLDDDWYDPDRVPWIQRDRDVYIGRPGHFHGGVYQSHDLDPEGQDIHGYALVGGRDAGEIGSFWDPDHQRDIFIGEQLRGVYPEIEWNRRAAPSASPPAFPSFSEVISTVSPPEVVPVPASEEGHHPGGPPLFYDPDSHRIFMGERGQYHMSLMQDLGFPMDNMEAGRIMNDEEGNPYVMMYHEWQAARDGQEVPRSPYADHVERALNLPVRSFNQDNFNNLFENDEDDFDWEL